MGKRKVMGRKKETRNANRTGGTSTRPDARTTLKIYTHFEEQRAKEALSRLDGFFWAASRGPSDGAFVGTRDVKRTCSPRVCGIGICAAGLR